MTETTDHEDAGYEDWDDVLPNEPNGEVVHWMAPRPMALGPTGATVAAAGAFALGALTTAAVFAVLHLMKSEDRDIFPGRVKRWRSSVRWP